MLKSRSYTEPLFCFPTSKFKLKTFFCIFIFLFALCFLKSAAWADVEINETNFPDENFRSFISSDIDTDGDGILSTAEINVITRINVSGKNIANLTGIEHFTALKELYCPYNQLTQLDLSSNDALDDLTCSNNQLTQLDLSNNTVLRLLDCHSNQLTQLDVSNNTALTLLVCSNNQITELKFNSTLARLHCYDNQLTQLDLSSNTALKTLNCVNNKLTQLDLSNNTALEDLSCDGNQLTQLDLSNNVALRVLNCASNQITELNIEGCASLDDIICNYNKITVLDLSSKSKLKRLWCNNDCLAALDLYESADITDINTVRQNISPRLVIEASSDADYKYSYDFSELIPSEKISNIISDSVKAFATTSTGGEIEIESVFSDDGKIYIKNTLPERIEYKYNTGWINGTLSEFPVTFDISGAISNITAPEIITPSFLSGITGSTYTSYIEAKIGTTLPLTWTVISGTLPNGLSFTSDSGLSAALTGTPTKDGTYTFAVQASNSGGSASKTFTIKIGTSSAATPPTITTSSVPSAIVNAAYGCKFTASGTEPITWSASGLPSGMNLDSAGYLLGTPTTSGTFYFEVQAVNSYGYNTRNFVLTVKEAAENTKPTFTINKTDVITTGKIYNFQLMATGTPPFTWSIIGKLPEGLTLTSGGLITGTVTKSGNTKCTIVAKCPYGSASKTLTFSSYEYPDITTANLKDATINKFYSAAIKTSGSKPLSWSIEGSLPKGLSFSNGKISGKPTAKGSSTVRVIVSNPVGTTSQTFTIDVNAIEPKIETTTLKTATYGKAYTAKIKTSGTEPITLNLDGVLPEGLTFNRKTGVITGIPKEECTEKMLVLTASNIGGDTEHVYYLTVKGVAPKITTLQLPSGTLNTAYSADLTATGSTPITWTATGLPEGLEINDGVISGSPAKYGKFNVVIAASNSTKTTTKKFKMKVYAPPSFNDLALINAIAGKNYTHKLKMSGTTPISFNLSGGTLPAGIIFNPANGSFKGKAVEAGSYDIEITAQNLYGLVSKDFVLIVNAVAPKISGTIKSGTTGKNYSSLLKAKGTAPITWTLEGNLPDGLEFNEGILSGTPSETWDNYIIITAENSGGKDTRTYRLLVKAGKTSASSGTSGTSTEKVSETNSDIKDNIKDNIDIIEIEETDDYAQDLLTIPDNATPDSALNVLKMISNDYKIIAELPEISVDVSGMYDFEVELDEIADGKSPFSLAGEELIWLACPHNSAMTEDDLIAEFYNVEGEEIHEVPENYKITVSAWLNKGIIYSPVIAVKKH